MSESDINSKNRMISLRLSEAEYQALKTQYRAFGARNVSDMARLALQYIMRESPEAPGSLVDKLAAHDQRLNRVESQLMLLQERDKVMS